MHTQDASLMVGKISMAICYMIVTGGELTIDCYKDYQKSQSSVMNMPDVVKLQASIKRWLSDQAKVGHVTL